MSSLNELMFREYQKYVNDSTVHLICVEKLAEHNSIEVKKKLYENCFSKITNLIEGLNKKNEDI